MIPGAILLSANIKVETLLAFFKETEKRILKRCEDLLSEPNNIRHIPAAERQKILENCQKIKRAKGWIVRKFMVDKCRFLVMAIVQFNPTAIIIICQFHIIQAILRWQGDSGRLPDAPRVPISFKIKLFKAFRRLQRCRSRGEWPKFQEIFFQQLQVLCHEESEEGGNTAEVITGKRRHWQGFTAKDRRKLSEFLNQYFTTNWFDDFWLERVTDIGLPPGMTRDGTANTNNWSESAFLTFDKVWLQNRKNKRIDCLGGIILDFLISYELWQDSDKKSRIPHHIQEMNFEAYQLWDSDCIREIREEEYRVVESPTEVVHVNLKLPRCSPCDQWEQTGKLCVHMRAAQIFKTNGLVTEWQEQERVTQAKAPRVISRAVRFREADEDLSSEESDSMPNSKRKSKMPADKTMDRQLSAVLAELNVMNVQESKGKRDVPQNHPVKLYNRHQNPHNYFQGFRYGWSMAGGRPSKIRPLLDYRRKLSKATKHVIFNKKRGRKPDERIHWNSLIRRPSASKRKRKSQMKRAVSNSNTVKPRQIKKKQVEKLVKNLVETVEAETVDQPKMRDIPVQDNLRDATEHNNVSERIPPPDAKLFQHGETTVFPVVNLSHWTDEYSISLEEAMLFIKILNGCSHILKTRCLFALSNEGREVHNLVDVMSCEDVVDDGLTAYMCFIRNLCRKDQPTQVILLDKTAEYWTLWHYDLRQSSAKCVGISPDFETDMIPVVKRMAHFAILNALKMQSNLSGISITEDNTPITTQSTCRKETSGFWVILMAFAIMTSTPPGGGSMPLLNSLDVKELLGELLTNFLVHPRGLSFDILEKIYRKFNPEGMWGGYYIEDNIVAARPDRIPLHMVPFHLKPSIESEMPSLPSDGELWHRISTVKGIKFWIGPDCITDHEIDSIVQMNGWVTDAIIQAYISLLMKDLERGRDAPGLPLPIFCTDSFLCATLLKGTIRRPFKPRGIYEGHKLWIPTVDIFERNLFLILWHSVSKSHWYLVVLKPREYSIRIYDSLSRKLTKEHRDVLTRVLRFLEYEHTERKCSELPYAWNKNMDQYLKSNTIDAPQQPDGYSCGVYLIHFVEQICYGREPSSQDTFDPKKKRREIAIRIAKECPDIIFSDSGTPVPTQSSAPDYQLKRTAPREALDVKQASHLLLPKSPLANAQSQPQKPISSSSSSSSTPSQCNTLHGPTIGSWYLWAIGSPALYYPAECISVHEEDCIVDFEIPEFVLDTNGQRPNIPSILVKTFTECLSNERHMLQGIYPKQLCKIIYPSALDRDTHQ
ncbi:hypothetical protein M422DRAFT_253594 [Sphaerobolus stellatus SS14]|uniref:Ubiquitin-like protease family profile domain-containing protein n=1 Tax=Sphaerobolus stellatus (strain SS14) TaxID=990650 RepID=A0A0C9VMK8_SPHS4|nr:hypothetical protein M422DRAFT_253594 [Sphaerobolus stellatus SS14]